MAPYVLELKDYLADLKEYIGNLKQVGHLPLVFEEYEVATHGGKEYLEGTTLQRIDKPIRYDSPAVLLALVGLVNPPLPEYFKSNNNEPMKKAIPSKGIIKFCERFGMPYSESHPTSSLPTIGDILRDHTVLAEKGILDMDHLRYKSAWLFTRFHVWYEFYSGEKKGAREYAARFKELYPEHSIEDAAKEGLASEVALKIDHIRILPQYSRTSGNFTLNIRAKDLFDIAYFHLANLLTMSTAHIRQHLKECQNERCSRLFWAIHGHQKYCEFCDRRIVHKQKKGREQNG